MGAKQSVQGGQIDRRPRSNSVLESNLQPPGPTRRTVSHSGNQRHNSANEQNSSDSDDDVILPSSTNQSAALHGNNLRLMRSPPRVALFQALNNSIASSPRNNPRNMNLLRFIAGHDVECPMCRRRVPSDDVEVHLVMCLTKPQLAYNEEVLVESRGECSICLDDMEIGQTVARLECLCLFHKMCLDEWFKRKNVCPQHPGDE